MANCQAIQPRQVYCLVILQWPCKRLAIQPEQNMSGNFKPCLKLMYGNEAILYGNVWQSRHVRCLAMKPC